MPGFETVPIRCPFPPCDAEWWVTDTGNGQRVPGHLPLGDAAEPWEGTPAQGESCPGSYCLLINIAENGGHVDAEGRARIDRGLQQWRLASQIKEMLPLVEQARRNEDLPKHPFIGFPLGGHPYEPTPEAFPGRPADAREPGPGDKPDKQLPMNQIGYPLGRAAMENAHAVTRNLLALTTMKVEEAAAVLHKFKGVVDILEGLANELAVHTEAAAALCTATVGMGDDAPPSASVLANNLQDARGRASVIEGGPLIAAVTRLNFEVESTIKSLLAGMEAASEFNGTLG